MDLSNILAINGKPGLFKLISKTKTNFIVESLIEKKRIPAFSHDGISSLDNIAIFTENEDVELGKVLAEIFKKENGQKVPDILNDNAKMKVYFAEVLPEYDKERVYVSNIKKVLSWYNLLVENQIITEESVQEKEEENDAPEAEKPQDEKEG